MKATSIITAYFIATPKSQSRSTATFYNESSLCLFAITTQNKETKPSISNKHEQKRQINRERYILTIKWRRPKLRATWRRK